MNTSSAEDLAEGGLEGVRSSVLTKEEIIEIMSLAKEREEPLVLSPMGMRVSFFCLMVDLNTDYITFKNPIPYELAPNIREASEFGLFCRMYQLKSKSLEPYGTLLRFPLPDFASLNQSRQEERVYFAAKEKAVVEITHPFDPGTVIRRRVFDLSKKGMSFRARTSTPFIQPNRLLPSCQIYLQGLPYDKKRGRIVYVKQIFDVNVKSYYQVGVKFIEEDEE